MPKPRCYFIGNTHIDHTWTWHWTEGFDEVMASWRAALELMERFPEFVFTASTTLHYRWVEENDPQMFAEIRRRVREGRWQLAGGWVVQADNNIPCGEAFVRQGLYGQRYFRSRFKRMATVGYCVDSFGHHAQLPQILRGQRMEGWLHFRPNPQELQLPAGPYRWQGVDGAEVIACRPPGWYCTPNERFFENTSRAIASSLEEYEEALFFYGVGDHGGGPTIRDLRWMRDFTRRHPELSCIHGGLDDFFRRARRRQQRLPIVRGELQHTFRGCYTTNGRIKELNRRSEGRLLAAESWAALAAMVRAASYAAEELERAWEQVLMNQFHDVICGTCAQDAMEEAVFRYGAALETAERVRHPAFKRLTASFNCRAPKPHTESLAVCVGNSLSRDRSEPLEFHPIMPGRDIQSPALVDGRGKPVDFQCIEPLFGVPGPRNRLLLTAEVPAGGIALYHVVHDPDRPPPPSDLKASAAALENRWWRVRIDGRSGAIRSLFEKRRGIEWVPRGKRLGQLLVIGDLGDTWGTGRDSFDQVIGAFTPTRMRLLENGPLRARLEICSEYGRCTARQVIDLYRDFDFIDCALEVMWNEKLKTLKLSLPLSLVNPRVLYEIPYGAIERPADGTEQPLQRWLQVSRRRSRFGVVVDSIGGADVRAIDDTAAEVRLTVLRSPYHGYLTPQDALPDADRPVSDQGRRAVRVRLLAGARDLRLPEHADSLSQPLHVAFEGAHSGRRRTPVSWLRCEPDSVHVAALKRAEDGRGFIVRLVETRGRTTEACVTGPSGYRRLRSTLRPFEIQTWRWRPGKPPSRCDLLELSLR